MSEEEVSYTSQRFADDSEVFDVVNDGIEFLLDSVETEADVRFADKLVVPLATKAAMLKLKRLTSWAVLQHDGVIDENDIEKPLEWLQADKDPKAIAVDSWARGMVPTRVVKAQTAGEQYRTLGGKIGDDNLSPRSQSASSRVSSNTGTSRSGTTRRSKSQYGGGVGSRAGTAHSKFEEEEEDPTGQIIELEDEFEAMDFGLGGLSLDQLLKKDLKNQNITEEEEEVERDHFEVQQEEIDAAIKDLPKGKKYVIDRDGQVIPINATSAAKLPPYQINPSTKIHNYAPPAPAASRGGTRGGTAQSGRDTAGTQGMDGTSLLNEAGSTAGEGKRAKKQIKVAGARMVAEDDGLFKPSHSLRDILSTGNSIVPTSGVTLVVDGQGRAGPEVASVPGRMSEKEYRARLDKGDVSRPMTSTQQLEVDPSLLLGAQAFGRDSVDQPPLNPDATTQMRQELQYKVPDIDPLEGGKRRGITLEHSSVEMGATDSYDEPPQEAIDTSRGKGIAQLPQPKQTGVRLYSHDTRHTGTPKDRDLPVNKKKPSELTKQKPPPPGKVSSIPPTNSPGGGGWGGPDSPVGVRTGGTGTGSPTGSVASKSVNSRASGKVGQVRSKGKIISDKPHLAKQIF
jgi:hypothetical protein